MTPLALASLLTLVVTSGYALLCAASPFGNCRKCRGLGFKLKYDRRGRPCRGKPCRRCDGIGVRIRVGRHLYNLANRHRADAR